MKFSSIRVDHNSSGSTRNYQTALMLNNIGVRLLDQHCYDQAVATLKDAAASLKGLVVARLSGEIPTRPCGEDCLLAARKRLAQPQPVRSPSYLLNTGSCNDHFLNFSEGFDSTLEAFPLLLDSEVLAEKAKLLCDKSECQTTEAIISLSMQTAVAFHNLAVAYQCKSKVARTKQSQLQQMALRFSRLSYSILVKQHNALTRMKPALQQTLHWADLHMPNLFATVLYSLVQNLRDCHQHNQANDLQATLSQLHHSKERLSARGGLVAIMAAAA